MSLAINIAIPLPAAVTDEVIRLNGQLDEQPNPVPLAAHEAIAHLTLAMGVIDDEALQPLIDRLTHDLRYETNFTIHLKGIYQRTLGDGRVVCGIDTVQHSQLQKLHETVMDAFVDAGFQVSHMGALYDYKNADPFTLRLIQFFKDECTYDTYFPHITLGVGSMLGEARLAVNSFEVNRVEIFHMGSLCTARKALQAFSLRQKEELAFGGLD